VFFFLFKLGGESFSCLTNFSGHILKFEEGTRDKHDIQSSPGKLEKKLGWIKLDDRMCHHDKKTTFFTSSAYALPSPSVAPVTTREKNTKWVSG